MTKRKVMPASVVPTKVEPGPRNKSAMATARQKYDARPMPVGVAWEKNDETGKITAAARHSDSAGHSLQLTAAFGTSSSAFAMVSLTSLDWVCRDRGEAVGECADGANAGLAFLSAIDPQDELEAALAVQMAGCHSLSMDMIGRAKHANNLDHAKQFSDMAVKLQRTFTAQVEALARLRGKGQQTVRVEHVTVQPGAQAIVGDVHHHAPGGPGHRNKPEDQPHGTDASASGRALPSPDALGNGVPLSSDAKREMSSARRTVTRRARRKSERS